jgi:hypothetical protein
MNKLSRSTFDPQWEALEHSDCQFGAVAVRAPNPSPDTNRPTISCPSENDVDCKIEPTMLIATPSIIVRLRPRGSTTFRQVSDLKKQPSVYNATTVPYDFLASRRWIEVHWNSMAIKLFTYLHF